MSTIRYIVVAQIKLACYKPGRSLPCLLSIVAELLPVIHERDVTTQNTSEPCYVLCAKLVGRHFRHRRTHLWLPLIEVLAVLNTPPQVGLSVWHSLAVRKHSAVALKLSEQCLLRPRFAKSIEIRPVKGSRGLGIGKQCEGPR